MGNIVAKLDSCHLTIRIEAFSTCNIYVLIGNLLDVLNRLQGGCNSVLEYIKACKKGSSISMGKSTYLEYRHI